MNDINMKNLADDFVDVVKEYRRARDQEERIEEDNLKAYDRRKSLHDSKNYVKLTRVEYWGNIIESKIKVIAVIGGNKLMRDFCMYLEEYEEKYCSEEGLYLVSCFDSRANGICGWYS